jgi:hypothetical protein
MDFNPLALNIGGMIPGLLPLLQKIGHLSPEPER